VGTGRKSTRNVGQDGAPLARAYALRTWTRRSLPALLLLGGVAVACNTGSPGEQFTSDRYPEGTGAAGAFPYDDFEGRAGWLSALVDRGRTGTLQPAVAGAAGAAGAGGAPADDPCVPATSVICGDGVRAPTEECDDGPGRASDLCTAKCQSTSALLELQVTDYSWETQPRYLGAGRHPLAGLTDGAAVVYVEPEPASETWPSHIGLAVFDGPSAPRIRENISSGTSPVLFANPVVAALPNDALAVAFTEFDGDGDELGIALRRIELDPYALGPIAFANQNRAFAQYDADILTVDNTLVVAWADDTALLARSG
jgi:cysteine-rich repeat protein